MHAVDVTGRKQTQLSPEDVRFASFVRRAPGGAGRRDISTFWMDSPLLSLGMRGQGKPRAGPGMAQGWPMVSVPCRRQTIVEPQRREVRGRRAEGGGLREAGVAAGAALLNGNAKRARGRIKRKRKDSLCSFPDPDVISGRCLVVDEAWRCALRC